MLNTISSLSTKTYNHIARPILFRFSSDRVHAATTRVSIIAQSIPFVSAAISKTLRYENTRLEQYIAGIHVENPIGLSAGFDKEAKLPKMIHAIGFGLEEVGSITAKPYEGNPRPWYIRLPHTESVVVNSGLRSSGVEEIALKADKMDEKLYRNFPINASIAKTNSDECNTVEKGVEDYTTSLKRLEKSPWPQMYTINISCPNTSGGEPFNEPENLKKLLEAIDMINLSRPVFLKLPIDISWKEIDSLLVVAKDSSLTGITIGNLSKNRSQIHQKDKHKVPASQRGNLSGRPCWDASNELLARCYNKYSKRFIFIGVGGVFSAEDAYYKIQLGASLVELISGMIFKGPSLIGEINEGLVELMDRDGLENISDAVGIKAKTFVKELV